MAESRFTEVNFGCYQTQTSTADGSQTTVTFDDATRSHNYLTTHLCNLLTIQINTPNIGIIAQFIILSAEIIFV
jgi:hypothetical protein